ncbi:type VII secretion system-associated protein [Microbacterium sp. 1P10UB]|uniref:type VII secretion system-associated protein n=1 Tax=unclassified Microbacterium TaxID=2609290 RepID=UPI0039A3EA1B
MTSPEEGTDMTASTTPPVTEALRAEARANPGAWIYAVDPGFAGQAEVPPEGIVGAWRSDENGRLTDEFTPNARHLPTPQARGWDEPRSALERVLQLVLSGYLSETQLWEAFAHEVVFVFSGPDQALFLAPAQDAGRLVYAYTDEEKVSATGAGDYRAVVGGELVPTLPEDVRIAINPGAAVSAVIRPQDVPRA